MKGALELYNDAIEKATEKGEAAKLYASAAELEKGRAETIWSQLTNYPKMYVEGLSHIAAYLEVIQKEMENPKTREGAIQELKGIAEYKAWLDERITPGYLEFKQVRERRKQISAQLEAKADAELQELELKVNKKLQELLKQLDP